MNELELILKAISDIKYDIADIKNDISNIKNDISEMKEDLEITRASANYNGEKLEELTNDLKAIHIISE